MPLGPSRSGRLCEPGAQRFTVVDVGFHGRIEASLDSFLPMRSIDVADRHCFDAGSIDDRIDEVAPAGSQPDATHANRLAGGWSGEDRRSCPVYTVAAEGKSQIAVSRSKSRKLVKIGANSGGVPWSRKWRPV